MRWARFRRPTPPRWEVTSFARRRETRKRRRARQATPRRCNKRPQRTCPDRDPPAAFAYIEHTPDHRIVSVRHGLLAQRVQRHQLGRNMPLCKARSSEENGSRLPQRCIRARSDRHSDDAAGLPCCLRPMQRSWRRSDGDEHTVEEPPRWLRPRSTYREAEGVSSDRLMARCHCGSCLTRRLTLTWPRCGRDHAD